MKQLAGYVLVKESGVGIPNLVVTAYDARDLEGGAKRLAASESITEKFSRRLGSVLTDPTGRFALSAEDLEFQGNESRPDLIVAVFAPEDIRSIEDPRPLPPEDRLLFVTSTPRRDSGAEEAFVIRLLQAQLDQFQIGITAPQSASTVASRIGDSIETSWNVAPYLSDRFQPRIKKQVDAAAKRRDKTKKAFKNFSGIPLHLRDSGNKANPFQNNTLVIKSRAELPTKLADLQNQSVKEGLTRLSKRKSKPIIRLHLTRAQVKSLGLKIDDNDKVTGEVRSATLTNHVRSTMKGFDLIKTRGIYNPSAEDLRRRYLGLAQVAAPSASNAQPTGSVAAPKKAKPGK